MLPDVLVERCTLTVRRRGGWSWGPATDGLIERALSGLERAIADAIAEAGLPPETSGRLDGTVRIRLGTDGLPDPADRAALAAALREQLTAPPAEPSDPPGAAATESAGPRGGPPQPGSEPERTRVVVEAMARTLGRWSRSGRLTGIAAAWPRPAVAAWQAAFATAARALPATRPALAERAVERIAAAVLPAPDVLPPAVRELVLLGAVIAAGDDRPPAAATLAAVRAVAAAGIRAADPALPEAAPRAADPVSLPGTPPPRRRRDGPVAAAAAPAAAEPVIVAALPFLVLVQLYRIGYLDGVVAAAGTAGQPDAPAVLGAALAALCLPPPGPGGRRTPSEAAAILAVACLPADRLDAATLALHGARDAVLAPLQAALTGCYAEGPAPDDPLVLTVTATGAVLGEQAGTLPIAWTAEVADLAPVLAQLGDLPVRRAARLAGFADTFTARRAFPALALGDLERHLAAAAGTALGSLALALWPSAATEADAPLLALERLADLEAEVTVGEGSVTVAVPRGRRWLDLTRGGFLDTWPVPWAPGGRWELMSR